MLAWIWLWDFIIAEVMKFEQMFYVLHQLDSHIFSTLGAQKYCFKVR